MNKKYMVSFIAVFGLFLIAWGGVSIGLQWVFGVVIPYLAVLVFATGFVRKVMGWSRSAVPFAIPTTGGQAKSFPWIRHRSSTARTAGSRSGCAWRSRS